MFAVDILLNLIKFEYGHSILRSKLSSGYFNSKQTVPSNEGQSTPRGVHFASIKAEHLGWAFFFFFFFGCTFDLVSGLMAMHMRKRCATPSVYLDL